MQKESQFGKTQAQDHSGAFGTGTGTQVAPRRLQQGTGTS